MMWVKIVLTIYFGLKVLLVTPIRTLDGIEKGDEAVVIINMIKWLTYAFFIIIIWVWL